MKKSGWIALVLMTGASVVSMGCTHAYLHSPSARVAPLEAAKTLEDGEHALAVYAGPSRGSLDFDNVSGRYRQGVSDQVEVGGDLNFQIVSKMNEAVTPVNPLVLSGRVGAKWSPAVTQDYVAVIGGLGAGTSVAGQFISPDLGVIFAFENRYVVPFVSANGFVSVPINAQPVDMRARSQMDAEPDAADLAAAAQTPLTTYGVSGTAGVRVPIRLERVTLAPMIGISRGWVDDGQETADTAALSAGMDVIF